MYTAHFELDTLDAGSDVAAAACVHALCQALLAVDQFYLREHPYTPLLYQSGVRYRKQTLGKDRWLDIPRVLRAGCGSCEDLAPWRVAELQAGGDSAAKVLVIPTTVQLPGSPAPLSLYHVVVQRGDGSFEDPSSVLGMPGSPLETINR